VTAAEAILSWLQTTAVIPDSKNFGRYFSVHSEIYVTISEGKFHQVKRMFEAVGKNVLYLKRVQMGGLKLDESLELGEYRELTEEEVDLLEKKDL